MEADEKQINSLPNRIDLDFFRSAKYFEDRLLSLEDSAFSTCMQSPISELQCRGINDANLFGLDYLINYQTIRLGDAINMGMFVDAFYPYINATEEFKDCVDETVIPLDNSIIIDSPIESALCKRRSKRVFDSSPLEYYTLSKILLAVTRYQQQGDFFFRNVASGGGLYPIDLYFYANSVESLENGFYLTQPFSHSIKPIKLGCRSKFQEIVENQTVIEFKNAAIIIFYSFDFTKCYQKYGSLTLALGLLEVGEIAGSLSLLCTSLGLSGCDIGGFDKVKCESILGLDGINNHIVFAQVVGKESKGEMKHDYV